MASEPGASLAITLAIDRGARVVEERMLALPIGARLVDALAVAGYGDETDAGIWGKQRSPDTVLKSGDRIEIYRPLRVDPKVARRERFRKQGTRATGLFARKD